MLAPKSDVLEFLKTFKLRVASDGLIFIPRKRNLRDLARLGLVIPDAKNIILGLTEKEYCGGPENDDDGSAGDIWVFGARVNGTRVYIKLKLDALAAKCLSFHTADYPMRFPYR